MGRSKLSWMDDEYLDVVNKNDEVVGKELRSKLYADKRSDYRVVSAFIRNSEGKLWIPRRTAHKKIFPLALDMSAAGHVGSGESYEDALKRELAEELRIDTNSVEVRLLGTLSPYHDDVSSFQRVYEIYSNDIPNFNKEDFVEWFWFTPQELIEHIERGEKAKSDLPKLVRHFYI